MQILAPWLYPNCNTRPDNVENDALAGGVSQCRYADCAEKGRYVPSVHMIKLTEARELMPDGWVGPDEKR
jgi:hypothetical protein